MSSDHFWSALKVATLLAVQAECEATGKNVT